VVNSERGHIPRNYAAHFKFFKCREEQFRVAREKNGP
jgi:hypothetical protein